MLRGLEPINPGHTAVNADSRGSSSSLKLLPFTADVELRVTFVPVLLVRSREMPGRVSAAR
jgi:hypothetical protein